MTDSNSCSSPLIPLRAVMFFDFCPKGLRRIQTFCYFQTLGRKVIPAISREKVFGKGSVAWLRRGRCLLFSQDIRSGCTTILPDSLWTAIQPQAGTLQCIETVQLETQLHILNMKNPIILCANIAESPWEVKISPVYIHWSYSPRGRMSKKWVKSILCQCIGTELNGKSFLCHLNVCTHLKVAFSEVLTKSEQCL